MSTIGIVGGVGPYAGLDLARKIFDHTDARCDQEHLDVLLINSPRCIDDRTAYILAAGRGHSTLDPATDPANPGRGILACLRTLVAAGATVCGVPCNTAHAPLIFDVVEREVAVQFPHLQLVHLIRETVHILHTLVPAGCCIGLLATPGTYASGVYQTHLERLASDAQYRLLEPEAAGKQRLYEAIYDTEYGIKAQSAPVTARALEVLSSEAWGLYERGADALIMGCTEIPLALDCHAFPFPLIDPAAVLARALIRAVDPGRLRPASGTGMFPPYATPPLDVTISAYPSHTPETSSLPLAG